MPLLDHYVPSPGLSRSLVLNAMPSGGDLPDADWARMRQPFLDRRGRVCVTLTDLKGGFTRNDARGGEPKPLLRNYLCNDLRNQGFALPLVTNATTMTKEAWIQLDAAVVKAARQRLRAVDDLSAASSFGGFNAMGKMTLEYQAMSDPGVAYVDMDGTTDGTTDTPAFILRSLPLPITHSDFGYSDRELQVSRSGNAPFDVTMGEAAGRRVAESLEDQLIGNVTGVTYGTQTAGPGTHTGTSTVYGYRNFPQRLTKTNFTTPTSTNGPTTYAEILAAIAQLQDQYFFGPYVLYHSIDWTQYMNSPFTTAGGNHPGETLRTMLLKNPDISDVRRLDRLTATFQLIFVQMTSDVAQMVNGMDVTTVSWQLQGGLSHRYKTLAIRVPRLRSDYNSRTGILHGSTS